MGKMFKTIIKVVGLTILFAAFGTFAQVRAQLGSPDLNVMNSLRDSFGWGAAFGWTQTNPCPPFGSNWNGVTCLFGRVSKLDLTCGAVKLSPPVGLPPFPNFIFMSALTELSVRSCYTGGVQATDISVFCNNAAACSSQNSYGFLNVPGIRKIRFDTGQTINGTLDELFRQDGTPPYQSQLNPTIFFNLTTLYLTDTKMSGAIPDGVMLFSSATDIRLNYDSFTGELPATGNASKSIWLNGNQLEGVLPDYIVNATGNVSIRYNKFDVVNTPAGNIDLLDPNWRDTQTVPPTDVTVTPATGNSALVAWTPIAYQQHGGYYEVLTSQTAGGPYTSRGTTAAGGGKTAASLTVSDLPTGVNFFIVRTFTPAHTGVFPNGCTQEVDCITENNPNNLTSSGSTEISANILGPAAASVVIGGRVLNGAGRGVSGATVVLTDQNGEIRFARTNPFGYYRFNDVVAGQTIFLSIVAKRYIFSPQAVTVSDELHEINFFSLP